MADYHTMGLVFHVIESSDTGFLLLKSTPLDLLEFVDENFAGEVVLGDTNPVLGWSSVRRGTITGMRGASNGLVQPKDDYLSYRCRAQ